MKITLNKLATMMASAGLLCTLPVLACNSANIAAVAELKAQVAQEKQKVNIYQAKFPSLTLARKAVISFHANLLEANYDTGFLVFELNAEEKKQLESFGFKMTVAQDFINKRNAMLDRLHASGQTATLPGKNAPVMAGLQEVAIPSYPCYETVEETYAAAKALNAADGAFNSTTEGLAGTVSTTGLSAGKHMVFVRAKDAAGAWGPITAEFIQIK